MDVDVFYITSGVSDFMHHFVVIKLWNVILTLVPSQWALGDIFMNICILFPGRVYEWE